MTIHRLKIFPVYFEAVLNGSKRFEIRWNMDRGFQTGDTIILQEHSNELPHVPNKYTGREIMGLITYVTNYEQKENYVVFGFTIISEQESGFDEPILNENPGHNHKSNFLCTILGHKMFFDTDNVAGPSTCKRCGHNENCIDWERE